MDDEEYEYINLDVDMILENARTKPTPPRKDSQVSNGEREGGQSYQPAENNIDLLDISILDETDDEFDDGNSFENDLISEGE